LYLIYKCHSLSPFKVATLSRGESRTTEEGFDLDCYC
jgi:hypothetical protein